MDDQVKILSEKIYEFIKDGKVDQEEKPIYYQDHEGHLSNHWITLHEVGNVSGFKPILVMDVWE